ncbi:GPO family capsid scaffolding protein [Pseudomonas guariconensis]|uniref:GPO family capsid scaffolding protein n=1 Tax=Pseudomonas TaxID=286 RepID=UPI002096E423|nr:MULTISPECIES: GPO family capsid scaffolding protein [Pseudomonas]MCO7637543.1 GPO family capsid scaffolding protein [Pseudomonas sp. S 311-6]MCO7515260.1 GPO family capsid scaffolding protein [Pseudomonas putida]MCO7565046.1 GPO family capsid scaffolding protein [Pseudomonas mosselii]MCO7604280.1 GPO family capsid scaffolding protein [Pseudomonas guariconensis]MCO7616504.1 GPO family capsid scaffolding protein [Pseudomonas guariconensis]
MSDSTKVPAKKFRSKWTRIAVEGATTDGRNIERSWIEDMASTYSPNTYGARINCEHIKWAWPGGEFGAYGDVVALKAEEVEVAGVKKLGLFAQLEPNEALLALNKAGQKVYTSIEVQPKFADSGKAYLVGLAVTDTPASLGTEALSFSAQHGSLTSRKKDKDNLFSAAEETSLEFEEITDIPSVFASLGKKVSELLGKSKDKEGKDAASFAALGEMIEQIATHGAEQAEAFSAEKTAREKLQADHDKLSKDFNELVKRLGETEDHSQTQRPPVTGGDGQILAEY